MVCDDIRTKTIIAMIICAVGVVSITIVLGLMMLRAIASPGYSALLLIMLMTGLFACMPFLSIYGTYKYAECLNNDLAEKINEWLYLYETMARKREKEREPI